MKLFHGLLLAIVFQVFSLGALAQKNGIYTINAFYQKSIGGTIKAGDESSAIRNTYSIYVETPANAHPDWETISIGGSEFPVQVVSIQEGKTIAGKGTKDHKNSIVKAKSGHSLWLVQSTATGNIGAKVSTITLKGKWKGKPVTYKIKGIKELDTIEYP